MGIGLTLQQVEGWEGQFDCMVRFLNRARAAANAGNNLDEMDFTLVMFQHALSLRDWVHAQCPEARASLERLFQDHLEMRLCRDIANGFKHLEISKPSLDGEFSIVFEYNPWGGRQVVLAAGHTFPLLELAGKCVELWARFASDNGLKPGGLANKKPTPPKLKH